MTERDPGEYRYDVAISLRAIDAPLAQQLADALAPLRVFVFTRRQQELAGTNLVETFTDTFARDARLAVILHREGWGESDYTHLEEQAIQNRGLKTRWRGVLLVKLDEAELPTWYHDHYGYLEYPRYPFDEVVGAIRAHAERLGADRRPETAVEKSLRLARAEQDDRDREEFMRYGAGLQLLRTEVERLFAKLTHDAKRIASLHPELGLGAGSDERRVVLSGPRRSTVGFFERPFANSTEGSCLLVSTWPYRQLLPGMQGYVDNRQPLSRVSYRPVYERDRVLRWEPDNGGRALSTDELADEVLLDQVEDSIRRAKDPRIHLGDFGGS
jgi:hypothetical protein